MCTRQWLYHYGQNHLLIVNEGFSCLHDGLFEVLSFTPIIRDMADNVLYDMGKLYSLSFPN